MRNRPEKRHRSVAIMSMDCKHNEHARCFGHIHSSGAHFHCGCACHSTRQINLPL